MRKIIAGLVVVVAVLAVTNIYTLVQVQKVKSFALDMSRDQIFETVWNDHMFNQIADKAGIELEEPALQ